MDRRVLLVNTKSRCPEQPSPPANLPTEIVDALNEATPEHLRDAASYAGRWPNTRSVKLVSEEADDTDVKEAP